IELPSEVLSTLTQLQHQLQRDPTLARLRWVRPEGIHLTLKFLGETPATQQPVIEAALRKAIQGVSPFQLALGHLGAFGSKQSPRVLWIDIAGDTDPLAQLQQQVEAHISPIGFPRETRRFSPHLTLARVPQEHARAVAPALAAAIHPVPVPTATMPVREVSLMQSDLRPGGAVYTRLFDAPLR
ncbi:MAG: RNA 2',3'-cyclic phosphodiesterase, partial [Dehalococcoidia bacterium]